MKYHKNHTHVNVAECQTHSHERGRQTGKQKASLDGLCHHKFVYAKVVKIHARTHTPKKPAPCQLCGKPYGNDGRLKSHIESSHHCNMCSKQVTTNYRIKHHKNCSHVDGSQLLAPLQLRPEFGEAADKVASGKELTEAMSSVLLEGIMYHIIALFTHYAKAAQDMMVYEYHNAMREFIQGMLVLAPLAKLFSTLLLTLLAQAHPAPGTSRSPCTSTLTWAG
jgi:hypothetical protein